MKLSVSFCDHNHTVLGPEIVNAVIAIGLAFFGMLTFFPINPHEITAAPHTHFDISSSYDFSSSHRQE